MTILRDISIVLVSVHSLILFIILFESRYPGKKTLSLITAAMLPLLAVLLTAVVFLRRRHILQADRVRRLYEQDSADEVQEDTEEEETENG